MKRFDELPDFLVIGAGKSGTTSIDKYLNQHPGVFVPRKKEPNFFGYENVTQYDLGENPDDLAHYRNSVTTLKDYLEIFKEAKPHQKKGETSNAYMYHPGAPGRIQYYNPGIRIIAILRHPAERLFSRFMHLARENRTPTSAFEDCLDRSTIWWSRNDLVKEGFYFRHLSRYFQLFPKENIRVYLYEDLNKDPLKVMEDIFRFIGVDPNFKPDVSLRYNESGVIKNTFLNKIYGQGGWLSKLLQRLSPAIYQKLRSNLALKKRMLELRSRNLEKKQLDPSIRRALTFDVYGSDIGQLQQLIGRDLSHWLKV